MIFPDNINIRDTVYRDIATKKELPEEVAENLIKTDKIWDEMLVSFVNDCLVKGKTDFFTHLKRLIST